MRINIWILNDFCVFLDDDLFFNYEQVRIICFLDLNTCNSNVRYIEFELLQWFWRPFFTIFQLQFYLVCFYLSNKIFYQILAWFFTDCLYPCQLFVWRSKQYKANWRKHACAHCICGDNTHVLTRKLYVYKSCGAVGSTNKA